MKSLITVINSKEAKKVKKVGCDILDIKNPAEGSLGAPRPHIIKNIKEIVPENMEMSLAVGDIPKLPCTVSLSVLGAAQFNPDYIKIGLKGPESKEEALELVNTVMEEVKNFNVNSRIVVAGYADYEKIDSVNPLCVPKIAYKTGADVGMTDTAVKDGKNLLDIMDRAKLEKFVFECHQKKLKSALAGSLDLTHVPSIAEVKADIFGVRGAVCKKNNRKGKIDSNLVKKLVSKINNLK